MPLALTTMLRKYSPPSLPVPQVETGSLAASELTSPLVKLVASNNAAIKGEVRGWGCWQCRITVDVNLTN